MQSGWLWIRKGCNNIKDLWKEERGKAANKVGFIYRTPCIQKY